MDELSVGSDTRHFALLNVNLLHIGANPYIDPAANQVFVHKFNQPVGSAFKGKHTFGHKIRKDDSVGDCRVLKRRTVGVGDRLHQQSHNIASSGKILLKKFTDRQLLFIVKVHPAGSIEKRGNLLGRDSKFFVQQTGKVFPIIARRQRKHGIIEAHMLELHNRISNFTRPIPSATFDHPHGESVK